ncbi:hypothetical protein MKW98_030567, partial [Papaver atlanticum]
HDQMIMLEGAKATTDDVDALRSGAAAMKAMQKEKFLAASVKVGVPHLASTLLLLVPPVEMPYNPW